MGACFGERPCVIALGVLVATTDPTGAVSVARKYYDYHSEMV